MDVVLLADVEKLGAEGTVVHVKPGFARNYLLPRGLAALATTQVLSGLAATKRRRDEKAQRLKADTEALKGKIEGRPLTLKLSLGVDDKPFGAITTHDVFDALTKEHAGTVLDKHAVHLEQPIKTLGMFEIPAARRTDGAAPGKARLVKA